MTLFLVAVTFGLSLANALELLGKMRLNEETYLAVEAIYYPGFTLAGIAEPLAVVASLVLVLIASRLSAASLLALSAFGALLATHAIFWFVTTIQMAGYALLFAPARNQM